MKTSRKAEKLFFTCFAMFLLLLNFRSTAFAVSSQAQHGITPSRIREWDNGAKVTTASKGNKESYCMDVKANTAGLKKGYYSIYLYDVAKRNIGPYDGMCFNFKNPTNAEVKINLTFTVDSRTSVSMTDSSYAILESADQNLRKAIVPVYGTISIPAWFDGTIFIPISKLCTPKRKNISLDYIQSWGITTVMAQDEQVRYQIGNINFLSGSLTSMKNYNLILLSGESHVAIPDNGSALSFYQVAIKDLNGDPIKKTASFYLKKNIAGVTVSKDGKLEVSSNCVPQKIVICSKVAGSIDWGELTVSLERKGVTPALGAGIPRPSDVSSITTAAYVKLSQSIHIIRIVFSVIILFVGAVFYEWFSESNINYIRIKNGLYHSNNNEEEEK